MLFALLCRRISIKGTARRAPTRAVYCVAFARICTACGIETTRCSPHRNQRVVARANTACGIETALTAMCILAYCVVQANTACGIETLHWLLCRPSIGCCTGEYRSRFLCLGAVVSTRVSRCGGRGTCDAALQGQFFTRSKKSCNEIV